MLSVIFDIFGLQLEETELYILAGIAIALLLALIIFIALRSRLPPVIKNREELYSQFSKLGDKKAKAQAKLSVVEEMRNYGRISDKEYNDQATKVQNEISSYNKQMDQLLKMLALPNYEVKLQQERGMETEKMSLLVRLQQDLNSSRLKIDGLQGTLEDLTERNKLLEGENTELEQKLDNVEESYKNRVIKMEDQLDTARRGPRKEPSKQSALPDEEIRKYREKIDDYYHKIQLYQLLVTKYKNTIESSESKTAQDAKTLVQPANSNITTIIQRIKSGSREPMKQYQAAFEFMDEIHSVPYIGATFWLTIADMLENKVADYEDKAILLCSILRALGADSKVLVASMADSSNRPLVTIALKDKSILLDPNQKHDFVKYVGKRNEIIKQFLANGSKIKRISYEFNDKEYLSHEE